MEEERKDTEPQEAQTPPQGFISNLNSKHPKTALIFGIAGIAFAAVSLPVFGFLSIVGLVFGSASLPLSIEKLMISHAKQDGRLDGYSLADLICGIIAVVLSIVMLVFWIIAINKFNG